MKNYVNLSIIIPHYNDFDTIQEILSLDYTDDVEVILVDDNSNDFDSKFVYPNNIKNFKLIKNNSDNKGAGACRNIGLKIAKGKWVTFVDSDDILTNNYYEKLNNFFDSTYDVVFFKPESYYINTMELADRHIKYVNLIDNYIISPTLKNEMHLRYDFDAPWSKLIRKSFMLNNSIWFDETLSANDTMCSIKIGYHMTNFKLNKEVFYIIHKYDGSLTTKKDKKLFDIRFNVRLNKYNFLRDNLTPKNFKLYEPYKISQGLLLTAYFKGFGFKETFNYFRKMKRNKMRFFSVRLLNPKLYYQRLKAYVKK